MIFTKAEIPKELSDIDDELKAIYHSEDAVCFFLFKNREKRNEYLDKTKEIHKVERKIVYQ